MVIFQYHLYIFGIQSWTVLYPKPCYKELCYKEVVVYKKVTFSLTSTYCDYIYLLNWFYIYFVGIFTKNSQKDYQNRFFSKNRNKKKVLTLWFDLTALISGALLLQLLDYSQLNLVTAKKQVLWNKHCMLYAPSWISQTGQVLVALPYNAITHKNVNH